MSTLAQPTRRDAELTAWAESDDPATQPGTVVRRGDPTLRGQAQDLFTTSEDDAALLCRALGRPSLGADEPTGQSPMLRVRAPRVLYDKLKNRANQEGRSVSAVIRDAAELYLAQAGRPA